MSKNSIEINGQIIPLPEGSVLAINYRAHDIRNLSSRDGSYAETLTMPGTNAVRKALENSHLVTSGTSTPYRLLPATLRHKGNIILTGHAGHTEVSDGFSLDVDGQNADLFEKVKGKKLADLDLSAFDHAYTSANVVGANSHNPIRGYLYPLINYGAWNTRWLEDKNQHFTEQFPAVYAITLLERMAAPYSLAGSLLADARFQRLVVPFTNGEFRYRDSYRDSLAAKGEIETEYLYDADEGPGTAFIKTLAFPVVTGNATLFDGEHYTVPNRGRYNIKATINLSAFASAGHINSLVLEVTNPGGSSSVLQEQTFQNGADQVINFDYTTNDLFPGDKIYIYLFGTTVGQNDNYFKPGSVFEVELLNQVSETGPVHLDANMPDITQEDFLQTIFNLFNVLIQADPVRGTIRLDLLEGLRTRAAVDWSRKIDWRNAPVHLFAFSDYGQQNAFGYEPMEYQDKFGNDIQDITTIPINNERLEPVKEFFISPFTSTEMGPAFRGREMLPYIPSRILKVNSFWIWRNDKEYTVQDYVYYQGTYWHSKTTNTGSIPSYSNTTDWEFMTFEDTYEITEAAPRLLLVETRPGAPIAIGDNAPGGSFAPVSVQGVFEKADGAGINAEAMRLAYHSITELMLTQTRIITLRLRLRLPEISTLDFLRPVILNVPAKNLQGLFYLNGVNQWNPDSVSCEVELVRLYGLPIVSAPEVPVGRVHIEFSDEFNILEFN